MENKKLSEVEKQHILQVLESNKFNRTRTAKDLGIGIRTLQRKLIQYKTVGVVVPSGRVGRVGVQTGV